MKGAILAILQDELDQINAINGNNNNELWNETQQAIDRLMQIQQTYPRQGGGD